MFFGENTLERKYEIFISSTKLDLEEEREYVQEQIIMMGHIPVGMELFLGERRAVWKVIQTAIDRSDFYILILAGRYGSSKTRQKSYTEKEFDYAVKKKKPIIAFVLDSKGLENLLVKKTEKSTSSKNKLRKFRDKVLSEHVQQYGEMEGFRKIFPVNVHKFIQENDNPDLGWIRAGSVNRAIERIINSKLETSIYRFMFNTLSTVKNVSCEFPESNIRLDPFADDIAAMLQNLANLLLRYVDQNTNPMVDIYLACKLDPEKKDKNKYAIVIGRKSKDSRGKDRLLDATSNCHFVYTTNTHRYYPDTNKIKDGENQFLEGEKSILSIPVCLNKECVGVIGFSSKEADGLQNDFTFAKEEVKSLCEAVIEAFVRRSNVSSEEHPAQKVKELISNYVKIDDENYQNIVLS